MEEDSWSTPDNGNLFTTTSQGLESHLWRPAMFESHNDNWEEKLKAEKQPAAQIIAEGTGNGTLTLEPRPLAGLAIVAPNTTPHVAAATITRTAPGSPGSASHQSGSTRSSQLSPRALKHKLRLPTNRQNKVWLNIMINLKSTSSFSKPLETTL